MRVVAVLANKEHPELGAISIPIPIRAGEYSSVMKMLSALGIGDVTTTGCSSHSSMMGETCPAIIMKVISCLSVWHLAQNQTRPQILHGFISPQPTNKLSVLCTAQALTIQKTYLFG